MKTFLDIDYTGLNDPKRLLDIYLPEGECRATVMWLHGGGLEHGDRKGCEGIAAQLCGNGIAYVSVEYRMYPECTYPDFINDSAAAAAWLVKYAKKYGLSEKIYIGGSSAGAYLSMMLCFARKYFERVSLIPEHFAGYIFDAGQPTTHFNVLKYRGEDSRLCRIDEAAALYHIVSARPARPLKFIYSEFDMPARPEQNRLMIATLKHMGYNMDLVDEQFMPGFTHCGYRNTLDENGRYVLANIIEAFVDKYYEA